LLPSLFPFMVSIYYSPQTCNRANRAVACAPFRLALFQTLQNQSVNLKTIVTATQNRRDPHPYLRRSLPEILVENQLLWLIQVGLLRREVDGQGITDSFRLTPLGHRLLQQWISQGDVPRATLLDRFYNALSQWLGV